MNYKYIVVVCDFKGKDRNLFSYKEQFTAKSVEQFISEANRLGLRVYSYTYLSNDKPNRTHCKKYANYVWHNKWRSENAAVDIDCCGIEN